MKTMNISLPAEMRAFVDAQVAKGGYGTVSEYIRALIRQDQYRQAEDELDEKLMEGLRSEEVEVNEEFWQNIRSEVFKKVKARKKAA